MKITLSSTPESPNLPSCVHNTCSELTISIFEIRTCLLPLLNSIPSPTGGDVDDGVGIEIN